MWVNLAKIAFGAVIVGFLLMLGIFAFFAKDLPNPDKVARREGFATKIYDRSGKLLYDVYSDQRRNPVDITAIPLVVKQATIAIEDKNFYKHGGFDILGIIRGALRSVFLGRLQSGSTLTQQLVKNAFLTPERSIVRKIKELEKAGTLPEEIVVIYRNNLDGQILSSTLAKFGIDYVVQGGGNVLAEPVVKRFLKILRVVDELRRKEDDIHLFTILNYDIFGIDPLDVLKISRCAADNKATLFDVIADRKLLDKLNLRTSDKVVSALSELANWQDLDANNTFVQFFEQVLTESGYLKSVLDSPDVHNQITRLNTLFEEVKKMNRADHDLNLRSFLDNLDLMEQNNLRIEEGVIKHRKSAITLTTAHSAKGLEWKHVFVYRLFDGQWGNKRNSDLFHLPPRSSPIPISRKKKKTKTSDAFFMLP